jgi:hypothetical protein
MIERSLHFHRFFQMTCAPLEQSVEEKATICGWIVQVVLCEAATVWHPLQVAFLRTCSKRKRGAGEGSLTVAMSVR